jgi:hypothetical protein
VEPVASPSTQRSFWACLSRISCAITWAAAREPFAGSGKIAQGIFSNESTISIDRFKSYAAEACKFDINVSEQANFFKYLWSKGILI